MEFVHPPPHPPVFLWVSVLLIFFSFLCCILCFACHLHVSYVLNVVNFSGLSILDCSFGFLYRLFVVTENTCGLGTANPYGTHEFNSGVQWSSCCSIFSFLCSVLKIIVCSFVHFHFVILVTPLVFSNFA